MAIATFRRRETRERERDVVRADEHPLAVTSAHVVLERDVPIRAFRRPDALRARVLSLPGETRANRNW